LNRLPTISLIQISLCIAINDTPCGIGIKDIRVSAPKVGKTGRLSAGAIANDPSMLSSSTDRIDVTIFNVFTVLNVYG
jgi:hypothetical protein